MRPEIYLGIEVQRCPICKGMFMEKGDVRALLEKEQGPVADDERFAPTSEVLDAMPATCPRCNQDMPYAVAPGDVTINQCSQCGAIFLDAGELATLDEKFSRNT
jgi:Zn-finger nucleic acid-binding protein